MEQLSPIEALSRLPGMGPARVLEQLMDGPTNASYVVELGGELFVLRLDKPMTSALGLDRVNERVVCKAVAAAGLTPAYSHFDPAAGVCLRPFVTGRPLCRADLLDAPTLERLAGVLRRLHGLPPIGARFDPDAAARRYATRLATPQAARLADQAAGLQDDIQRCGTPLALCHNDLVAENMLATEGQGIVLIDWEYAGVGDPFFDLAVVVRHHGLADDLADGFLEAYLQGRPSTADRQRFGLQCAFYACLLELWNLL